MLYLLNDHKVLTDCSKLVVNNLKHIHMDYPKLPDNYAYILPDDGMEYKYVEEIVKQSLIIKVLKFSDLMN